MNLRNLNDAIADTNEALLKAHKEVEKAIAERRIIVLSVGGQAGYCLGQKGETLDEVTERARQTYPGGKLFVPFVAWPLDPS